MRVYDRVGKFSLTRKLIEEAPYHVLEDLFYGAIILKAEYLFHAECMEYVAYHPDFPLLEDGVEHTNIGVEIKYTNGELTSIKLVPNVSDVVHRI